MNNPPVFLDTAASLALANRRDNLHEQAERIRTRIAKEQQAILTSEWVLVEFLNALQRPPARTLACQMVEQLRQSKRVRILPVSTEDWQRGYRLYQERPDKAWSLVDCISMQLCHQESVREIFTSDRNFPQAGYQVLMQISSSRVP